MEFLALILFWIVWCFANITNQSNYSITNAVLLADLDSSFNKLSLGLLLSLLVSLVIFGGIKE